MTVPPSYLGPSGQLVISTTNEHATTIRSHPDPSSIIRSPGDPLGNIISLADSNISQAESILSSLGCERRSRLLPGAVAAGIAASSQPPAPYDGDVAATTAVTSQFASSPLSSDIESNIRKLELTQAKINAALHNFRAVRGDDAGGLSSTTPPARRSTLASTLDNAELFNTAGNRRDVTSLHRVTYPQSSAEAQASPSRRSTTGQQPPEPLTDLKLRKTSLFRRHSFNQTHKDKPSASPAAEGRPETSAADRQQRDLAAGWSDAESARSSVAYDDCAYSDSEGGSFSPLKNRIRGLLGSFGKGKKKLTKSSPRKRPPDISMRDPLATMDGPAAAGANSSDLSESLSIGQFTELVKSLPANSFSSASKAASTTNDSSSLVSSPSFLRPRAPATRSAHHHHRPVAQNNSNDTFSSVSTNQSFNVSGSSNRNSVVSVASISSESFDADNNSASDCEAATTSTSSPPHRHHQPPLMPPPPPANDNLTPEQRQERKLFFIAREIMSSEEVYVDVLRLLNTEFREFVQKARAESKSGILPDQDFVKLFSNLPELMMLNEDLLRDFRERVNNWSQTKKIADVIVKKGPYLKLYTVYIRDFSAMNYHFEECCTRFPKFAKLVKEFEKQPRCQHLRLQHYMLKPVQRLPQVNYMLVYSGCPR